MLEMKSFKLVKKEKEQQRIIKEREGVRERKKERDREKYSIKART